jgi:hypothetical protein
MRFSVAKKNLRAFGICLAAFIGICAVLVLVVAPILFRGGPPSPTVSQRIAVQCGPNEYCRATIDLPSSEQTLVDQVWFGQEPNQIVVSFETYDTGPDVWSFELEGPYRGLQVVKFIERIGDRSISLGEWQPPATFRPGLEWARPR